MHDEEKKCYLCDSTEVVNESCSKCGKAYCALDASRIDPALCCDECLRDVVIEETTYTRKDEDFDLDRNVRVVHSSSCKQIIFKGIDWMFACRKMCECTEDEKRAWIHYHSALVDVIETDILNKSIQKSHEYAQVPVNRNGQRIITTSRVSKTREMKTAKINASKVEMLAELAFQSGITTREEFVEFLKNLKVQ